MKTTKTIKNSEYRMIEVGGGLFDVWLFSCATGKKLAKRTSAPMDKQGAIDFIDWILLREK